MRKLLIKLSSITITSALSQSPMIFTSIQNLNLTKKETIKIKRDISCQENNQGACTDQDRLLHLNTADIGTINYNDEKIIKERFQNYLLTEFKDVNFNNYEVSNIRNIKYDSADVTLSKIGIYYKDIKVKFKTAEINLKTVINNNNNLDEIEDNSSKVIHTVLQEKNPDLANIDSEIKIIEIKDTSALVITGKNIENYYNNKSLEEENIEVITFETKNYLISSFISDTKLGILSDNKIETILSKVRKKNPKFEQDFEKNNKYSFKQQQSDNLISSFVSDLGILSNDKPQTILSKVKEKKKNKYSFKQQQSNNINYISLVGTYKPKIMPFIYNEKGKFYRPATNEEQTQNKNLLNFRDQNIIKFSYFLNSNLNLENKLYKVIDNNTKGGNVKPGYIYLVDEENDYQVCLKNEKGEEVGKFNFDEKVIDITLDGKGSALVTTESEKVYQLILDGWNKRKLLFESKDIKKEIKIFYRADKKNKEVIYEWGDEIAYNTSAGIFNLGPINPLKYKYVEILGNSEDLVNTRTSWSDEKYSIQKNLKQKFNLREIIRNKKITKNLWNSDEFRKETPWLINSGKILSFLAGIEYEQMIGINFFWEAGNYYLEVLTHQNCKYWNTSKRGAMFLNLGIGLRFSI